MNLVNTEKRVLELFKMISDIPRPPYKEERIADFICGFAKKHGCEYYRDEAHNVLVNVKATNGKENVAPMLLQGHTDMVCEKNEGVEHDFLNEGIHISEKDGWLVTDGTTLGADNGVAVAIMLYVIEGGIEEHGDVQCLFTSAEEVGLDGVKKFDFSKIYAKRMINMDGENENCVIVGCAGGLRSDIKVPVSYTGLSGELVKIKISGLCGGHSGENIASGRANANILMGRLLLEMREKTDFSIVHIYGGTKENAIPREAVAYLAARDSEKVKQIAEKFMREASLEMSEDDKGFKVSCGASDKSFSKMMDEKTTRSVISFISCVKNGIMEMSKKLPNLVEYSKNLGIITTAEDSVTFRVNSRSAIEAQLDASERELAALAKLCGGTAEHYSRYPGWVYSGESALADEYIEVCKKLYSRHVEKEMIHAGLECGIIKTRVEGLDCISCGPIMKNLHSPDETMNIESFGKYAFAVCTLIAESK